MAFQEFTPLQYLQMDIASNFGLDKEDWDDRLQWFDANERAITQLANLEKDHHLHPLMQQAEEPAMFFAGVKAWNKARRGEEIRYPISLDATASGAQLLALAIGCEKSARHCNLIDTGHRQDLYTNAYKFMLQRRGGDPKISRQSLKDAIMPALYTSVAAPERVFGKGTDLHQCFLETMDDEFTGVWRLTFGLLNLWRPDVLEHAWVLPDNFHVHVKVMDQVRDTVLFLDQPFEVTYEKNKPMAEGRSLGANLTHSLDGMVVREMLRRCSYDESAVLRAMELVCGSDHREAPGHINKKRYALAERLAEHARASGFLSARVIDVLDEHTVTLFDNDQLRELLMSLPEKPFKLLTVHDCFRAHPNYGNDLRRQYNRVLYEIARSSMLDYLTSQVSGREMVTPKMGDFAEQVLEANYALS